MSNEPEAGYIAPKNWTSFQHYKDRSPTWIKLHKTILDNYEYQCLPLASKALAPMLWLLASEYEDGKIPADLNRIAFRLRVSVDELESALSPLINNGFFVCYQGSSEVLADCLPRVREEKEKEKEKKGGRDALLEIPSCIPVDAWEMWDRYRKSKKGWTADAKALSLRTLTKIAEKGHDPRLVVETSIERGWTGLFEPKVEQEQTPKAQSPRTLL